eukprot:12425024-Karenia_brevis.AAC.1
MRRERDAAWSSRQLLHHLQMASIHIVCICQVCCTNVSQKSTQSSTAALFTEEQADEVVSKV